MNKYLIWGFAVILVICCYLFRGYIFPYYIYIFSEDISIAQVKKDLPNYLESVMCAQGNEVDADGQPVKPFILCSANLKANIFTLQDKLDEIKGINKVTDAGLSKDFIDESKD